MGITWCLWGLKTRQKEIVQREKKAEVGVLRATALEGWKEEGTPGKWGRSAPLRGRKTCISHCAKHLLLTPHDTFSSVFQQALFPRRTLYLRTPRPWSSSWVWPVGSMCRKQGRRGGWVKAPSRGHCRLVGTLR